MRAYYIHVLIKVNNELKDVKFLSTKSVVTIENNHLKIEIENTFGDFVEAGYFNMDEIVGYYNDLRTVD